MLLFARSKKKSIKTRCVGRNRNLPMGHRSVWLYPSVYSPLVDKSRSNLSAAVKLWDRLYEKHHATRQLQDYNESINIEAGALSGCNARWSFLTRVNFDGWQVTTRASSTKLSLFEWGSSQVRSFLCFVMVSGTINWQEQCIPDIPKSWEPSRCLMEKWDALLQ